MKTYSIDEKKANIETWLTALESGNFTQAKGALNIVGKGFCCLGVGCEVLDVEQHGYSYEWTVHDGDVTCIKYGRHGDTGTAPEEFRDMVGLCTMTGEYRLEDGTTGDLTTLNDEKDWNFRQIADLIRSRPDGMFEKGV